jgi:hypothetical protein
VAQVAVVVAWVMFLHLTHLHQQTTQGPDHLLTHSQGSQHQHIIHQHLLLPQQQILHTKLQWKTGIVGVMELVILVLVGPGLVVIAEVAVALLVVTVGTLDVSLDQLKYSWLTAQQNLYHPSEWAIW